MKKKCSRCSCTCFHINGKCTVCGFFVSTDNKIIEAPGLVWAYLDNDEIHYITLYDPSKHKSEIAQLRDSGKLLYHATYINNLSILYMNDLWKSIIAGGVVESSDEILLLE